MGEETINEKVTPNGIPDPTNPMKIGTAEQEQKGVRMPRMAADRLPSKLLAFLPSPRSFLVFSGGKKLRIIDVMNMIVVSIKKIMITSVKKNSTDSL
jgi:hypothetical protein